MTCNDVVVTVLGTITEFSLWHGQTQDRGCPGRVLIARPYEYGTGMLFTEQ